MNNPNNDPFKDELLKQNGINPKPSQDVDETHFRRRNCQREKELVYMRWISLAFWFAAISSIFLSPILFGNDGRDYTIFPLISIQFGPIFLLLAVISTVLFYIRKSYYKRTITQIELQERLDRIEAQLSQLLNQNDKSK